MTMRIFGIKKPFYVTHFYRKLANPLDLNTSKLLSRMSRINKIRKKNFKFCFLYWFNLLVS